MMGFGDFVRNNAAKIILPSLGIAASLLAISLTELATLTTMTAIPIATGLGGFVFGTIIDEVVYAAGLPKQTNAETGNSDISNTSLRVNYDPQSDSNNQDSLNELTPNHPSPLQNGNQPTEEKTLSGLPERLNLPSNVV